MSVDIPGFAYAAAIAAGGIMGYVKSQSIPSLGAGLLFGSIIGYGAFLSSQNEQNYGVILGSSAALGGLMGYRFYNTGKVMPAGMIAAISAVMVIRYSMRVFSSAPAVKMQYTYHGK